MTEQRPGRVAAICNSAKEGLSPIDHRLKIAEDKEDQLVVPLKLKNCWGA